MRLSALLCRACLAVATSMILCAQEPQPAPPPPVTTSPSTGTLPPATPPPSGTTPSEPLSIELFYWLTDSQPNLRTGRANTSTTPGNLDFVGKGKQTPGITVAIPAGKGNALKFTYEQASANGSQNAPEDLSLFSVGYSAGDYLATNYKLRHAKITYDFLSYPTPLNDSSWRFRTLWEVQYVSVNLRVDAPFNETTVDSSGNVSTTTAEHSRQLILPAFGAAIDKKLTRNFRVEAKATGFGIPRRADVWDAEASAAYSFKQLDVIGAYRGFHYKTSPAGDTYAAQTFHGAYVGLRWNFGTAQTTPHESR